MNTGALGNLVINSYKIGDSNGVQYLYIPELKNIGINHFFNTRNSGDLNSIPFINRDSLVMVNQVHGDNILVINRQPDNINVLVRDALQKHCDAIITDQPETGIGIATADCLPVLLHDPVRSVIAVAHAGWRGTVKGVLSKVVSQMTYMFKCRVEDIVAGIGPAIGSCCYIVGDTVIEPLKNAFSDWQRYLGNSGDGKARLDLTALNVHQLVEAGVLEEHILSVGLCTSCNDELFFSYRRDNARTGRMISGIML